MAADWIGTAVTGAVGATGIITTWLTGASARKEARETAGRAREDARLDSLTAARRAVYSQFVAAALDVQQAMSHASTSAGIQTMLEDAVFDVMDGKGAPLDDEHKEKVREAIEPFIPALRQNFDLFSPRTDIGVRFADVGRLRAEASILAGPEVAKALTELWSALLAARGEFITNFPKVRVGKGSDVARAHEALTIAIRAEVQHSAQPEGRF